MTDRGVVYMMLGTRHLAVLAVSLWTLRKHWDGPVAIFTDSTGSSGQPLVDLAHDSHAELVPFDPRRQKRHSGYASKPMVPALAAERYKSTIQLDADTMVVGDFGELWPAHDGETVITQFAGWVSTGRKISKRIFRWQNILPNLVQKLTTTRYPAINTGVLSYGCKSDLALRGWLETTLLNSKAFISDEIAMQLVFPEFPDVRVLDDRWNYSPIHGTEAGGKDARVVHNHGRKWLRGNALKFSLPMLREAWSANFGGMKTWIPSGDNRMEAYLKEHPEALKEIPEQC